MTPSDPGEGQPDLALRRGGADDLDAVADLHLRVRAAAVPAMPPLAGDPAALRAHLATWDLEAVELWLAEGHEGALLGYAVLQGDWLHSLYVDPDRQGAGVGSVLLDLVASLRPEGFCLWVFESNAPARRFYARRGLVELERTDGSGNAEGAPDLRLAWPGRDPMAFLRRQVDEVDAGLGDLLARRAALTRAIQDAKRATGASTERDPGREQDVVRRLAARAPALGEERLTRLVEVLVAESLSAAEESPGGPPGSRGAC